MASIALATAAALSGGGAYLDAKYGLTKDLRELRIARKAIQLYAEAVKNNRISLYYLFENSVKRRGDEDCIWSREGCYSWNETYANVNRYANWFLEQGVQSGDYVAFYLSNSPEFLFAWLGLWAIGAAPAMINCNLAGKALTHCLGVPGAKLLLVDDDPDLRKRIEDERAFVEGELGMKIVVLDQERKREILSVNDTRPGDEYRNLVKGNSPMSMFFTSGTTGMPKGCPFNTDRGFMAGIARDAGSTRSLDDDRWYDCMPLYHGTGGVTGVSQLMSGSILCIGKKFSTSKFWQDIHDSRATYFVYVGETARYLLAAPPSPLDKDHNIRCMYGNGLRPDVWTKFQARFNIPEVGEFFNSSEGVFVLANFSKNDYLVGAVGHHGAIRRFMTRNIYVPVLVDQETGSIARNPDTGFAIRQPYEIGGEIIVQVPNAAAFGGYYKNALATEKKFERDVFKKGDLWFRSGDALWRDPDGRWYFKDRLGDTYRWKGENVSTAEVAEVLGKFEGVVEANVYGVALPKTDGRAGCAAIYVEPGMRSSFDFDGLLRYARTHLPKYAVPIFIRVVNQMTPIHNNKQNKVPLREEGVDPNKVEKSGERILWIRGDRYVDFRREDWEDLEKEKARL